MKKIGKTLVIFILTVIMSTFLSACSAESKYAKEDNKLKIVVTIFPCYDFTRAVTKDEADIKMLLKPGAENHSYEPSAQDIIDIENSDVFVYIGGESEVWVERILENLDSDKTRTIRLIDCIDLKKEELKSGMESGNGENNGYDEHIWTSPVNAVRLVEAIKDVLIKIDTDKAEIYQTNSSLYINELALLDQDIQEIVAQGNRNVLIFGDRFPFRYFVDEYGLNYYAAFPGCATQNEASVGTIADLIDRVKKEQIPVVFYLEFSNQNIAKAISEATGTQVLLFHSAHNISQQDFKTGKTYLEIMRDNVNNLKEALK